MPEQLKIVIDADVNKAIAGVKELSKVITADFTNSTNAAAASASRLSADVAASVQKINASLSSLKITSLDVKVNTSTIDESIKGIQSKFAALVDPQINVLANTELAEVKIKELLADLSTLKGSEIFIKANDVQALKAINEIETELNSLVGKQINLSVTADLSKIEELKAKIASLKVTPVDVVLNTSAVDASIKNIQAKFNALVDPQVNILANTELAEAKIKELISDLSTLKGSEIFISANDAQALSAINGIEAELNSLLDKQIRLNVSTGDATQKISLLEKELLDLQNLSIDPKISSTQLGVFEANIKRVKAEIASLRGAVVPIGIDTGAAQAKLNTLSETIETIRGKIEARKFFITVETDITKIAQYNKEIESLEARMRSIQNVGKRGFELFVVPNQTIQSVKSLSQSVASFGGGVRTFISPAIQGFTKLNTSVHPIIGSLKALEKQSIATGAATTSAFTKAFGGLRSLAALIPGIGLGGIIGLAATAVNSLTNGFFEAAFGASKLDKAIDAASESIDKNSASVITMVKALQSGTLTSSEFQKVKAALIEQAPEFQKTFNGDKISIEASEDALKKYIQQLTNTIRVTAALGIVNDTLAESLRTIAKGGEVSFGSKLTSIFKSFGDPIKAGTDIAKKGFDSLDKAIEQLKPENISKLLEETFKKLGITFTDFVDTVDPNALKRQLDKIKAEFEKFQNETISRARLFSKEFGSTFIVPDLEESFFVTKNEIFKRSLKLLDDVRNNTLKIRLPLVVETKTVVDEITRGIDGVIKEVRTKKIVVPIVTELDFLPVSEGISQSVIDNFFKGIAAERKIPIEIVPDISMDKVNTDLINLKTNFLRQFKRFGDFGLKEFFKIDFTDMRKGLDEAAAKLQDMQLISDTLAQSVTSGLTNAFNSLFDAILEGRNAIKALGSAVKALVVETIKAVVQMFILKAITTALFPASAGAVGGFSLPRGQYLLQANPGNFGQLLGIGSRAFNNVLTVNVNGQISGDTIRLAGQRAANSQGRFG